MIFNQYFKIILCNITLFILCVLSAPQQKVKKLDLYEGDVCRKGLRSDLDYVCTKANDCKPLTQSIKDGNYLDICSFNGSRPIVCCPSYSRTTDEPNSKITNSNTVDGMCRRYFELNQNAPKKDKTVAMFVVGGKSTKDREFPHMALLGFGSTADEGNWGCGGSLISGRWILTAAHCQNIGPTSPARWARLGVTNSVPKTGGAQPKDFRIVQHVLHPDFKPPSRYNDIALFRLETEVEFSEYVKPICLNSDPSLNPEVQIATGWGRTSTGGPTSTDLLKVDLNIIPADQCNASYFSNNDPKLKFGITSDSMICAGSDDGERDTCAGDSGGPLQTINYNYTGMYTQFGITAFGKFCGDKDAPGVYTRVSKYITWIEKIAFPITAN